MENKFLEKIAKPFNPEIPFAETMDGYLDQLIPIVRSWGEDLWEEKFYVDKPWLEVRDDEHFHHAVLHFFNEGGEYLKSVDGDVTAGSWRYMPNSNKLIIESGMGDAELFDLAFMDAQFFVLQKHGNQERLGERKYFVMVFEPIARRLEWRDAMLFLFNKYRNNNSFYITVAVIILLIIAIIFTLS